ncbi:hypothetical protein SAMN05216227_10542 [Pseudorhodobacter antarcticus]|uniref:Uncharacterized protein n=1 Tax=Pseudorhodobacter antarcticus TaxID=1077947 RepID=A0A1H8MEF5_9RHOB|nr:hypothetical protein SAMN05216227_10542 [Pseudorhodobacter antarcticus]
MCVHLLALAGNRGVTAAKGCFPPCADGLFVGQLNFNLFSWQWQRMFRPKQVIDLQLTDCFSGFCDLLPNSPRGPADKGRVRAVQADLCLRSTVFQAGCGLRRPKWQRWRMLKARVVIPIFALARIKPIARTRVPPLSSVCAPKKCATQIRTVELGAISGLGMAGFCFGLSHFSTWH